MAYAKNLEEVRALIASHKRWDLFFACVGVLALMIGVLTFVALFADMAVKGVPRLDLDFFTSFPSRRAGRTGQRDVCGPSV